MTTLTATQTATLASPGVVAARPRVLTWPLVRLLVTDFGAMTGFYLLLSAVPLYATSIGAGGIGAGLSTGVLMLASVGAELITPRLAGRFGYRRALLGGLILLGAPALLLPLCSTVLAIMAVSVVRGIGFAVVVVTIGALGATVVPAERRGEGLGVLGVVSSVPAIVALPLGVWLVPLIGYPLVFAAGAAAALAGVAAVVGLPGGEPDAEVPLGVTAGLRTAALAGPATVFAATAMAGGIVVSFVPVAVGQVAGSVAVVALLVQAAASTLTRWWAGRHADRYGAVRLLAPGLAVSAAGILALVLIHSPAAVLAGMVVFGTGFGVTQSASMAMMMDRVAPSGYGTVSAMWNMAYDLGWGAGAATFGILAAVAGYPAAFAATAALMLFALPLAHRTATQRPER